MRARPLSKFVAAAAVAAMPALAAFAVATGAPSASRAQDPGVVRVAQAAGKPVAGSDITQMSREDLERSVRRFVEDFYLSGRDLTRDEIEALYAPRVDYFGGANKSRSAIVRDKLAYFRRWPDRTYVMIPETFSIARTGDDNEIVNVMFEYYFDARGGDRVSKGHGFSMLTLDFSVPGGRIVREQGKVLSRD